LSMLIGWDSMEKVLIAALILLTAIAQLWINHPKTFESNSRLVLMFSVFLLHLFIVKLVLVTADNQGHQAPRMISAIAEGLSPGERMQLWKLAVPYAFAPLI